MFSSLDVFCNQRGCQGIGKIMDYAQHFRICHFLKETCGCKEMV